MPVFQYKATNAQKTVSTGTVSAPSADEAAANLKKKGLQPIMIKPVAANVSMAGTLPMIDKIAFCRYVGTMLKSGLSLTSGIPALRKETKNPLMRQILDDIVYNLERGQPLSGALTNYPKSFEKFFITMIKSGELSGTLADSFSYLERQLRAEYSLSSKIKSAMMYPSVVFIAMLGIAFLMFFFVLPSIGKVFLTMTIPLPLPTRLLFTAAISLSAYKYAIIAVLVVAMIGMFLFLSKPVGKKLILRIISPFPIVNSLLQQIDVARFCRIFSTLVASAVPITDALEIALASLNHPKYAKLVAQVPQEVSHGKSIAESFAKASVFPALLTQMLAAGEKSGTLDSALADLADFYEEEVGEAVKKSTELLEPMMMLVVGVGVGATILSIIAPLYSVVGNLQAGQSGPR